MILKKPFAVINWLKWARSLVGHEPSTDRTRDLLTLPLLLGPLFEASIVETMPVFCAEFERDLVLAQVVEQADAARLVILAEAWEYVTDVFIEAPVVTRRLDSLLDSGDSLQLFGHFLSFDFILDFAIIMKSCLEAIYERACDY